MNTYTLYPIPYALHPTPYTLDPTPIFVTKPTNHGYFTL